METARLAFLGAAMIVSVSTLACADSSVHTATYATLAEARQAGAIDKGWVPGELPGQAYELRAAYDLDDADRRWGLFNFRAEDHDALRAILAPGDVSIAGVVMDILRTHPMVIVGEVMQENPFYTAPDDLIRDLASRRPTATV